VKRAFFLVTVLLTAACSWSCAGLFCEPCADDRPSPIETTRVFFEALRFGKPNEALQMIARAEGMSVESVKKRLSDLSDAMTKGEWDVEVLEHKQEVNCAVAVVNEKIKRARPAFELIPCYLIHQDGGWKVSPRTADYGCLARDDRTLLARFKRLEEWFEERKRELSEQRAE
jgi:hypothetical protein